MIRVRATLLLSSVIFALFLVGTLAVDPADAQQPPTKGLRFSVDGKEFSEAPPKMFSHIPILVPGDKITEALWIRNVRDRNIEVNVEPDIQTEQSEVHFRTEGASTFVLHPGQSAKVSLQLELPFASTNRSERLVENSARVIISAAETLDATHPDQNVPEDQESLGDTGFGVRIFLLALGTLAAGSAILWSSRRKKNTETMTDGDNR